MAQSPDADTGRHASYSLWKAMQFGTFTSTGAPFMTMVPSSRFTRKKVMLLLSWFKDTKNLLLGKRMESLGY